MKILFLMILIISTVISTSSNSWLGVWVGLEINLLSFIPLMSNSNNLLSTEASLKYFLTQAIASAALLFSVIFMSISTTFLIEASLANEILPIAIMSSLLLKSGGAPFHFWLPGVMEGLNWLNCLILMAWQKIAPLMLISYCIKMSLFTSFIIISSVLVGSIGGLNQTSLRKLLAYSSINHLGWMVVGMLMGENLWLFYFSVYSFLIISTVFILNSYQLFHLNQIYSTNNENSMMKFALFSILLSLGGLPPFLGFLPKWIIIQSMLMNNMISVAAVMVLMTLFTLYYYLQVGYSAFLITHSEMKWNMSSPYKPLHLTVITTFSIISIMGLMVCTLLLNIS